MPQDVPEIFRVAHKRLVALRGVPVQRRFRRRGLEMPASDPIPGRYKVLSSGICTSLVANKTSTYFLRISFISYRLGPLRNASKP